MPQKLTKNQAIRTMILVQYKAPKQLNKMLKINHPMLRLYALKVCIRAAGAIALTGGSWSRAR